MTNTMEVSSKHLPTNFTSYSLAQPQSRNTSCFTVKWEVQAMTALSTAIRQWHAQQLISGSRCRVRGTTGEKKAASRPSYSLSRRTLAQLVTCPQAQNSAQLGSLPTGFSHTTAAQNVIPVCATESCGPLSVPCFGHFLSSDVSVQWKHSWRSNHSVIRLG